MSAIAAWLAKKLLGAAAPYLLAGVAAVVLGLGGGLAYVAIQAANLRTDLATAGTQIAELQGELTLCQSESAALEEKLQVQNAAVDRLFNECKSKSDDANKRADQALAKPPRLHETGGNVDTMNRWLDSY